VAALLGAAVFLALCAGIMVPLERLAPRAGCRPRLGDAAICITCFFANTLLMAALGPRLLAPLERACASGALPTAARLVAAFVLADLIGYLLHRAMHGVPWLWRIHRVHHAARELSWLEAWRQHPFDFLAHGIAAGIPGALLGVSLSQLAALVVARKAWTAFLHADVDLRLRWLTPFIATPAFHHAHHAGDARRNFAGTFPLWDALFATSAEAAAPPPEQAEHADQHRRRADAAVAAGGGAAC
jgi:sterol desaturase/sphingolipid hydroxylase (fatty acid hydroxylase superfamily)